MTLAPALTPLAPALPFQADEGSIEMTLAPALSPLRPALPFQGDSTGKEPPEQTLDEDSAAVERAQLGAILPFGSIVDGNTPITGATQVWDARSIRLPGADSARLTARLTISQHAALCADLAARPSASEEIFARYGLSDLAARGAEDGEWRKRLGSDPGLYRQWKAVYDMRLAQVRR